jgi:translation initiation factor IF-2
MLRSLSSGQRSRSAIAKVIGLTGYRHPSWEAGGPAGRLGRACRAAPRAPRRRAGRHHPHPAAGGHRPGPGCHPGRARPGGIPVDPRGGRRADRHAVWDPLGTHHRRRVPAFVAVQPTKAAAARLGATPGGGAPLARGGVSRHPRPGPPGGRGGVAGRAGRARGCGGGPLVGAGGPHPGHPADRQAVWGGPAQRDLQ